MTPSDSFVRKPLNHLVEEFPKRTNDEIRRKKKEKKGNH